MGKAKPAGLTILAITFWMGAITQAFAVWDGLGDLQLHHGGERFLRDVPLNEPAKRLRLTSSDDDIFCRSVSATIGATARRGFSAARAARP
jgi:hypothetical protein